ncbi:MAG: hypothetical protein IPK82_26670 [Polyangiaceae bacterium]|nr:hypothetical protein [Polyangiaceae bacterium]
MEMRVMVPGGLLVAAVWAEPERLHRDFGAAGFTIKHIKEQEVDVMKAVTVAELIAWTRAFCLARLLADLPEESQQAWETDPVEASKPLRKDGYVRLGGVSGIVVPMAAPRRTNVEALPA